MFSKVRRRKAGFKHGCLSIKQPRFHIFWCRNFNNSKSIFLALKTSENLNFHIFRMQITLDLNFELWISINEAISVACEKNVKIDQAARKKTGN